MLIVILIIAVLWIDKYIYKVIYIILSLSKWARNNQKPKSNFLAYLLIKYLLSHIFFICLQLRYFFQSFILWCCCNRDAIVFINIWKTDLVVGRATLSGNVAEIDHLHGKLPGSFRPIWQLWYGLAGPGWSLHHSQNNWNGQHKLPLRPQRRLLACMYASLNSRTINITFSFQWM